MMSHVVSLKWAEKLKKSGYAQRDCQMHWNYRHKNLRYHLAPKRLVGISSISFAAPSVDELLLYLPTTICHNNNDYTLRHHQKLSFWAASYEKPDSNGLLVFIEDKNRADTLARLWLHLKEKRLLS